MARHNGFLHYLTARLENAEFILRLVLPEDFCQRVEWSTLKLESRQQVYATPHGQKDLEASVSYARRIGNEATGEVLHQVLHVLVCKRRAEEIMGLVDHLVSKEALQEAQSRGLDEGLVRGEAKARAEYVLRLLDARDIPFNRSTRERILACRDLAQLDRWFDRALHAHSLEEVLGEPKPGSV